jgi:hypothetical protein
VASPSSNSIIEVQQESWNEEVLVKSDQPREVALQELGQLTLRAIVVYAVRCARRMRPCFQLPAEAPRRGHQIAAVDAAIRVAEAFCRGLPGETGRAAETARVAGGVAEETCAFTRFAGYAALHAASAAAHAEEAVRDSSDFLINEVVAAAFGAGRVVLANADTYTRDLVLTALLADVEKLLSLAHDPMEGPGPAIDPSESGPLGPLWPDGTPGWCAGEVQ